MGFKPMNERRRLKLDIRKEHQEIQLKFEVLVCIVQCHYCFLVDYFSPVFLLFPFLPSHNCVERFDLLADNNTIVSPYKDTSWHLICLCLDAKRDFFVFVILVMMCTRKVQTKCAKLFKKVWNV